MCVHIAIPEPTSLDSTHNQNAMPAYLAALRAAGASPVIVPLHERQDRVARLLNTVQGILLPGSPCDVDPMIYGELRQTECGAADPARIAVDELMLQDAFSQRKPILAICGGAQNLNVWRGGSLFQNLQTTVNHRAGRDTMAAHSVLVTPCTRLSRLFSANEEVETQVNSTHHQAINRLGDQLRIAAISPADGIVEAVELDSANHFVMAVQWHPERSYTADPFSRAIFSSFIQAASVWEPRAIAESVVLA